MTPPSGGPKRCQRFGCGNVITPPRKHGARYVERRRYCSRTCSNIARTQPITHATYPGYQAHLRRSVPFVVEGRDCGCRAAGSAYHEAHKKAGDAGYRALRAAASRAAHSALAKRYPREYTALRREHLRQLSAEQATRETSGASWEDTG